MTLFVGNSNVLELIGLQDVITEEYINNATVTVTLVDPDGVEVVGASWPLTLPYVTGTDGDYRVVLTNGLTLTDNVNYTAQITADGGTDLVGFWQEPMIAQDRKFT